MLLPPDQVDAIVLTLRAAGCVFAEDEAALLIEESASPEELDSLVARRVAGEPLEYILGWAQFCGLRIRVAPTVFVPRQRTAFLVQQAVARLVPGDVVLDLCCGSGAVAAAILAMVPGVDVYAADIEPAAVACARTNLASDRVFEGDLYRALPDDLRGRIRVLAVNAPYVPTAAVQLMPPEARLYEAPVTLDGGPDGLDVHRRVAAGAGEWLAVGGSLIIETGEDQAPVAATLFADHGLLPTVEYDEDTETTVVIGTLRP